MKNIKAISLGLLLVLSLGVVAVIVAKRHPAQVRQGYTLYERESFYSSENPVPVGTTDSIRYQKSDGSWRKDSTCNGRPSLAFALAGRGAFNVNEANKTLQHLGNAPSSLPTEEMLRSEKGFVREEWILGFRTLLIHSESGTGEANDFYICPALQDYPLKRVTKYKDGSSTVFEVSRVVLGEPAETLFSSLPNYSVEN